MNVTGDEEGSAGCQQYSTDLVLEVILASLPATASKLSREQSIDFGTVLESLKSMLKQRELTKTQFMPFAEDSETCREIGSDVLIKTWEAFQQNSAKVFHSDIILISASNKVFVEIVKQIGQLGRQIDTLPQIFLAEFKSKAYEYSLQSCAVPEF